MKWRLITAERFHEALNCLPPRIHVYKGFLAGEPVRDRPCTISGKTVTVYSAFLNYGGLYYACDEPMGTEEFRLLVPADALKGVSQ